MATLRYVNRARLALQAAPAQLDPNDYCLVSRRLILVALRALELLLQTTIPPNQGARQSIKAYFETPGWKQNIPMPLPTLVIISGPSGSGKTTLAHELARAIPCPALCRDEIKEGMVHAHGEGFEADWGDSLTQLATPLFFDVLNSLVLAGVTVVAEAAFQQKIWGPNLEPLLDKTNTRIIQCHTDPKVALQRIIERGMRLAHADSQLTLAFKSDPSALEAFDRVSLPVPWMDVDTTEGYKPSLPDLVAFINGG
jgi:predicted kinase